MLEIVEGEVDWLVEMLSTLKVAHRLLSRARAGQHGSVVAREKTLCCRGSLCRVKVAYLRIVNDRGALTFDLCRLKVLA